MDYFVQNFQVFLLIMVRMFTMLAVAPMFSSGTIPFRIRAITAVYISVSIFPMVAKYIGKIPESMFDYALMVGSEALIGILIGFMMSIIFASFQLAARFFSFQMALGIAEVIDPLSEVGITIVGQLWTVMGLMVFIAIQGPQLMIIATYDSYKAIRLFKIISDSRTMFEALTSSFVAMFVIALKLSFPILATLFVLSVTLGMLAKAAPQMNIFMLGLPIQIGVGFIVMVLVIGAIVLGMSNALTSAIENLMRFIHALGK